MRELERLNRIPLRTFASAIGQISIFFEFYVMDIGDARNQKIYMYDIRLVDNDRSLINDKNFTSQAKVPMINIDFLTSIFPFWSIESLEHDGTLSIHIPFFEGVELLMEVAYGEERIYLLPPEEGYDSRKASDLRFTLREGVFDNIIKQAPQIDRYILDLQKELNTI